MRDMFVGSFVIGIIMYIGKALMIRLILGKRFHHWITSTPFRLGIMDFLLGIIGARVLLAVHAEGLMALIVLTGFGACTTVYIFYKLATRKAVEVVSAIF